MSADDPSPPRVHVARAVLDDVLPRAAAGFPNEVCGLLLGDKSAAGWRVVEATQGGNLVVDRQHDRYQLDPAHYLAADRRARELGLDIVGVWHTHPDHPPIPSSTDREHAWDGFTYWIVPTTRNGAGDGRWWILDGEAFAEIEAVQTTESPA
ncbi:MAG: M67 family metallopeptidase [Acidobacteriota bacterium]